MDAFLQVVGGIDWKVGVMCALGAALLIARGARISAEGRAAERDRKIERMMPPKRGR